MHQRTIQAIADWKAGIKTGQVAHKNCIIRGFVRRYLLEKFNSKCIKCGWGEVNATSGKIPLEVNHIDGNAKNSVESNLELLCPNCHSLTSTYKNLNKGKSARWNPGSKRTW